MDPLKAKANYSRVCHLLVDKGGDVLRNALHAVHPPSTLASVLNANKKTLQKIRYSVIKASQWDLLFPRSGTPDSNNFDITLLTVLLRNICGLSAPATGWNVMPPVSDTSISANILRVKMFRNEVYGHIPTAGLDDVTFETLWQEISVPLAKLGIPQNAIDELKVAPLSPEEESYIERLKEWKQQEDDFMSKLSDVESKVVKLTKKVENVYPSHVEQLAKFNFAGKIRDLCRKFQDGTRKWLFDKLSSWFGSEESRVLILTAGPGVGKSVLSAKLCELFRERGQLAAHHFCDFRNSDSSNPQRILQSLASQMCDNVEGFRDKLTEILRREHSRDSLSDAFRVLLNDPLHALDRHEPMLIIVDALDESKTDEKSELLELISERFCELPDWIKIFISSRPELQVRKILEHLHPWEIRPDDEDHNHDIELFVCHSLPNLDDHSIRSVISKCEGSFLYAYYLVSELREKGVGIEPELSDYISNGISGYYEKQFKRLDIGLQHFMQDTSCLLNSFINVVAVSKEALPIKVLFTCMGLSKDEFKIRKAVLDLMSEILPVYDGCLTVYHKSLWDWLTLNGYEEHAFVADVEDGNRRLWRACKKQFCEIDALKSVFEFQISPENRYALENGLEYLVNTGEVDEFHWLVHVVINFLKIKFFDGLYSYFFRRILGTYRSKLSKNIYWGLIQHVCFFEIVEDSSGIGIFNTYEKDNCYVYLQALANGHFDFLQGAVNSKSVAKDILGGTNEIWIEYVTMESHSNLSIVPQTAFIDDSVSDFLVSPDQTMLACIYAHERKFQMLKIPDLTTIFETQVTSKSRICKFLFCSFSPDSSYILYNSIRFCINIKEKKEVPFITHGPDDIIFCSFSSCGMKLVTLEKTSIKVWDVKSKNILVEVKNVYHERSDCLFSNCNSYILLWPQYWLGTVLDYMNVLNSETLEKIDNKNIRVDQNLCSNDSFQMFSPPHYFSESYDKMEMNYICLPSGEKVIISNKYCSKVFVWKNRKCVAFVNDLKNDLALVVYDFINQKIVDVFEIGFFPRDTRVNYISKLDGTSFLLSVGHSHKVLSVLSFKSVLEWPDATFVDNAKIDCRALSPDTLYVACCFKNCFLSIRSVESGETLQTVALKQRALACWWSESYLWLVCEGLVVKYRYEPRSENILGSQHEESIVNFERVLAFKNGVLVIYGDRKLSILRICNEKLCYQETPSCRFTDPSVAISSDGCAVMLLLDSRSDYQLWEIECGNTWIVRSTGELNLPDIRWWSLSGTKTTRNAVFLSEDTWPNIRLLSITFPNDVQNFHNLLIKYFRGAVYIDSDLIAIFAGEWIHFVKVSEGRIIASRYFGDLFFPISVFCPHPPAFFLPSTRSLLFVDRNGNKYFKIHNIEKYFLDFLS
ncbi:uncharacterized protein LOC114526062 [Dendronephthya gigantea]|uniref:uncharacterized protein LOC114526062 n=1 Tax=Dendronephthya gigantea TaxID=151771 RepID=UPI00106AEF71|nr:uncharacterized protein LOC114526062 [Dendronephthya gigantea]XP_028403356.1 uncharacterized protein LOC114526062 [Dendronephthya gigantea]XP_028403357.1 uncharacterized protein LOC114526062 [Dendronephthya gigantea]XP_028403359.1 uncharacterized protein LOC114526062 [Dendronephthya gigantea]XP_028403360.1 uncharacterized protein LOC114526062 [Dendronephthya gigantea]XP_028403361.1 uncharacterized protein LOC114526062 [Dendronephthya gigantea]